jgi:hypothetical protein
MGKIYKLTDFLRVLGKSSCNNAELCDLPSVIVYYIMKSTR